MNDGKAYIFAKNNEQYVRYQTGINLCTANCITIANMTNATSFWLIAKFVLYRRIKFYNGFLKILYKYVKYLFIYSIFMEKREILGKIDYWIKIKIIDIFIECAHEILSYELNL